MVSERILQGLSISFFERTVRCQMRYVVYELESCNSTPRDHSAIGVLTITIGYMYKIPTIGTCTECLKLQHDSVTSFQNRKMPSTQTIPEDKEITEGHC